MPATRYIFWQSHPVFMRSHGHILIVEDELVNATFIEYQLTKLGYSIAGTAHSGIEAIHLAQQTRPDLVLMDIQLEGELDGIETARRIRGTLGVPVVYLTSTSDAETIERARTTDAFGYLSKPFHEQEVHTTIQIAVSKAQSEHRVRQERKWLATALLWVSDAVIAADPIGTIQLLNPAAAQLTGWSANEASGRDLDEVLQLVQPETGDPCKSVIDQLMSSPTVPAITERRVLLSRDGVKTDVNLSATCITADSGDVTGVLAVFRRVKQAAELDYK